VVGKTIGNIRAALELTNARSQPSSLTQHEVGDRLAAHSTIQLDILERAWSYLCFQQQRTRPSLKERRLRGAWRPHVRASRDLSPRPVGAHTASTTPPRTGSLSKTYGAAM